MPSFVLHRGARHANAMCTVYFTLPLLALRESGVGKHAPLAPLWKGRRRTKKKRRGVMSTIFGRVSLGTYTTNLPTNYTTTTTTVRGPAKTCRESKVLAPKSKGAVSLSLVSSALLRPIRLPFYPSHPHQGPIAEGAAVASALGASHCLWISKITLG